jgi:hypothetical protein
MNITLKNVSTLQPRDCQAEDMNNGNAQILNARLGPGQQRGVQIVSSSAGYGKVRTRSKADGYDWGYWKESGLLSEGDLVEIT